MRERILAVDFGTTTTAAILLLPDGTEEFIEEPSTHGRSWPSAVSLDGDALLVGTAAEARKRRRPEEHRAEFKRDLGESAPVPLGDRAFTPEHLVGAVLAAVRREAERIAGGPVTRAVLTVPASYAAGDPRAGRMLAAAATAGFTVVELLPEPVAAAGAPVAGDPLPAGTLLLVYDFGGGTFDTALVRLGPSGGDVLGHAALDDCGGRDVDRALTDAVTTTAGPGLPPLLGTARAHVRLATQVVGLKHRLTEAASADDDFGDSDVLLAADRPMIDAVTAPLVARTLDCVRALLDRCGVAPADVGAVLLVGGVTRMPVVEDTVCRALGRPVRHAKTPELSVVQGAARFAARSDHRHVLPDDPRPDERPLRWPIPGGAATLLRWRVAPGDRFGELQPLAEVRHADGSIWELRAQGPGRLAALHADPGAVVSTGDWLMTARLAPALLSSPGDWVHIRERNMIAAMALSADGTLALTYHAGTVDLRDGADGRSRGALTFPDRAVSASFHPDGHSLAVAVWGHGVYLSGLAEGSARHLVHQPRTHVVRFAPDGRTIATADGDHVRIVDATDGRAVTEVADELSRTSELVYDGTRLTGAAGRTARILRATDGALLHRLEHPGEVTAVALSPAGDRLATGCLDATVRLWDPATGTELTAVPCTAPVLAVAFSPDGSRLAVGGASHLLRIVAADTGAELMPVGQDPGVRSYGVRIPAVSFSADGSRLAALIGAEGRGGGTVAHAAFLVRIAG